MMHAGTCQTKIDCNYRAAFTVWYKWEIYIDRGNYTAEPRLGLTNLQ
jgi:hypothetical protein